MSEQEWRDIFRRNLRVQLRRMGWTQKDLAYAIGVSPASISRYINGARVPDGYILLKLANALECTADDLIRE